MNSNNYKSDKSFNETSTIRNTKSITTKKESWGGKKLVITRGGASFPSGVKVTNTRGVAAHTGLLAKNLQSYKVNSKLAFSVYHSGVRTIKPTTISTPINVGQFIIWPDQKQKTLFYIVSQPELIDFSLTVYKKQINNSIQITNGKAVFSVSINKENTSELLEALRDDPKLNKFKKFRFKPLQLKELTGKLIIDNELLEDYEVVNSAAAGQVSFLVNLTDVGSIAWEEAVKQNKSEIFAGICGLNLSYYAKEDKLYTVKQEPIHIVLRELFYAVKLDSLNVIDPQITVDTSVIIVGHPQVESVNLQISPNNNFPPEIFNFDSNGGRADASFSGVSFDSININIRTEVNFTESTWPLIIEDRELSFNGTNFATTIKPSVWLKKLTLSIFFYDSNNQIISIESDSTTDRFVAELSYKMNGQNSSSTINHVIEASSETFQEILLPSPPGSTNNVATMKIFTKRGDALKVRQIDIDLDSAFLVIKVNHDATYEVVSQNSPMAESSMESHLFKLHQESDQDQQHSQRESFGMEEYESDEEGIELYDSELYELSLESNVESLSDDPPLPIPPANPAPFAPYPPAKSYWPIITSHSKGREVAYQKRDGTIVGRGGRRWLANRSNGRRYHVGVDLFGRHGDPVVAIEDGRIIDFYPFYSGTNALIVEHSNVVVNYGEVAPNSLSANGLRKGDAVRAGQVIGFVGRLGSGSSMIHFETYTPGTRHSSRWMQNNSRPNQILNPTEYLLYLKRFGLRGSLSNMNTGNYGASSSTGSSSSGYPTIDINKAIILNRRFGNSLGWDNFRYDIYVYLGYTDMSPSEEEFAYEVANWQKDQGFTSSDIDGILGSNSWQRMEQQIFNSNNNSSNTGSDTSDTSSSSSSGNTSGASSGSQQAISLNNRYAVELGWGTYRDQINILLGYTYFSPSEEEFVYGVMDWQYKWNVYDEMEGVIGQNTWQAMRPDINTFGSSSLRTDNGGTSSGIGTSDSSQPFTSSSAKIKRVWSWYYSNHFLSSSRYSTAAQRIIESGITDYVVSMNLDSNAKHNSSFRIIGGRSKSTLKNEMRRGFNALANASHQIDIHLMVFLNPKDRFVREAVELLIELCQEFQPRSVLFDAEGWWRNQTGDHQAVVDKYIVGRLRPALEALGIEIGYTDFTLNSNGIILGNACDYVMPQSYSTTRNDGYRENGGMQERSHYRFKQLNKKIVMALAAWNLRPPADNRFADNYESMQHTIDVVERLISPSVEEVAYWWLPTVFTNHRGADRRKQFIQDLSSQTRN